MHKISYNLGNLTRGEEEADVEKLHHQFVDQNEDSLTTNFGLFAIQMPNNSLFFKP